jgi:hypothetical protein
MPEESWKLRVQKNHSVDRLSRSRGGAAFWLPDQRLGQGLRRTGVKLHPHHQPDRSAATTTSQHRQHDAEDDDQRRHRIRQDTPRPTSTRSTANAQIYSGSQTAPRTISTPTPTLTPTPPSPTEGSHHEHDNQPKDARTCYLLHLAATSTRDRGLCDQNLLQRFRGRCSISEIRSFA